MKVVYVLLVAHFVGDFLCQTDWMAINKSKSWHALTVHVAAYASVLFFASALLVTGAPPFWWLAVNFCAHFATDAVTSRINARLWQANARHWFFVGIGADQLVHYVTLIATAGWLLR